MTEAGRGVVWVEYHQFYLDDGGTLEWSGECENGLIAPLPDGGAVVSTGVALGHVDFEWVAHDERPGTPAGAWDRTEEIPLDVRGALHVEGWGAMSSDPHNLALHGPGSYIVRCSVRDRGDDGMTADDHPTERYLIEVWPASRGNA